MRKYETFFIVDPDLPDEVTASVDEKFQTIITSQGGVVLNYSPWGKKKLAYPVKKRSRGLYVLAEYSGGPELVAELERNMRLDERVLKFITVKLEDRFDPEKELPRDSGARPVFDEEDEALVKASEASDEEEGEEYEEGDYEEEENE
ncbi:30S ribosomal protein S6 [Desulfoferrobacter suflitae]|uniref:30S ribosomal protein S6 n=1 Tax=Desulfoferrobacter suflitae TaxID=2865782 RepID=UPI0021644067|nr:30S ribosomal protein S6 [Desulfoferrobacter suflitae]MCK8600614.1 30S ribosomal protein S6 [Desulfoferrobacter suflitae]